MDNMVRSGVWQVDTAKLFALLSTHLYPHRLAFLRELVANAVDATLLCGDHPCRKVMVHINRQKIEIVDNGCGLSPDDVGQSLGRVGVSGTHALCAKLRRKSAVLPPPSGMFGVGLLGCWNVAEEVTLLSWTGRHQPAIEWQWTGGANYKWRTCAPPVHAGTRLTVRLNRAHRGVFSREQIIDYLGEEMPFVATKVVVDGEQISEPTPPWRLPKCTVQSLLRWANRRDFGGVLAAACVPLSGRVGGGLVVLLPNADTMWSQQIELYRGGIRVRRQPQSTLVPSAFSWMKLIIDAPGIPVALDRESLTEEGGQVLTRELQTPLMSAFDELLDSLMAQTERTAWLQRHRDAFLEALRWRIQQRPDLSSNRSWRLAQWLPFQTQTGWTTLAKIVDHNHGKVYGVQRRLHDIRWLESTGVGELAITWRGQSEQDVCLWLARKIGLSLVRWTRGETVSSSVTSVEYPTKVDRFCGALRTTLAERGIQVIVDPSFTKTILAARWLRAPVETRTDSPVFDLGELASSTDFTTLFQPILALNPWSPVIQHLSTETDQHTGVSLASLLVEYASSAQRASASASARDLQRRLQKAMFALIRGRPPLTGSQRCYVAYDWRRQRLEFEVIKKVFESKPYNCEVIDASTYQSGRYFLENILNAMDSAHLYVSVLDYAEGLSRLNYNVLMEAGVAASYRGRPHLVCFRQSHAEVSNLDGFIGVEYRTLDDLAENLDSVARRRELHLHAGREKRTTS